MSLLVPTAAALAGACVYGVSGVLQQRATHRLEGGEGQAFIRRLLRQPLWVYATVGSAAGFVLQGVALATGPIVLVQPLLVTGVLFAALTGFLLRRGPVDWVLLAGLTMTAGGLALFLVAARPVPGGDVLTLGEVVPLAAVLAVLILGCLALAVRQRGTARSLALALAAGIIYGVTAAIAKVTLAQFGEGPVAVLTHWSLWTVAVLGPLGFLFNQHAFHAAVLASPVVAVITVTDPLVGIGIGLLWLGESVGSSPVAVLVELLGLAVMCAGVFVVATRAPHLAAETQVEAGAPSGGRGRRGAETQADPRLPQRAAEPPERDSHGADDQ